MKSFEEMSADVRECPLGENRLSEKQLAALELMLLGRKPADIAQAVDVDARTIRRWKNDEVFREELDRRRGELWSRASNRLAAMVNPALDVLESQLGDRYEHTRFRAASAVLRLAELKKISVKEQE